MSHLSAFIESVRQKSKLHQLRGILNGFSAAEQDIQELRTEMAAIRQNLETLSINVRNNNARLETLESHAELARAKLTGLERKLKDGAAAPSQKAETTSEPVSSGTAYEAIDYFDFENHFRGSIEHIKQTQRIYLPYFAGKQHVLDFGCGRGEFLSLMQEEGIPAEGVDIYEPYIDHCTLHGLQAHCGDGIAYLRQMQEVDGIFVGQVIEHLQIEQIISLCELAFEKLPEGGCIIMETPNPTSLAIYTNAFYIDPSHIRPVHPLTMQYLLEKAGFTHVELLYPEASCPPQHIPALAGASEEFNDAMQSVSRLLFGSQDYAVIAVK